MAKKPQGKPKFDWSRYSRPARLLTDAQEAAFASGILRPILDAVHAHRELRFDIRARSASVHYRGSSLVRISGDGPFVAELDSSLLLPRAERSGEKIERRQIETAEDVAGVIATAAEYRDAITAHWASGAEESARSFSQAVAATLSGPDLFTDEYVVVDLEYTYGKRRYDLVALHRTEGVTGPGAFASPQLAFIDTRRRAAGLTGNDGLAGKAGDFAELTKALAGSHMERAREELLAMVQQKSRLGLLPADLECRSIPKGTPQWLVVFGDAGVAAEEHDAALLEGHERLAKRHHPNEQLRYALLDELEPDGDPERSLQEGEAVSYRDFKEWRKRERA